MQMILGGMDLSCNDRDNSSVYMGIIIGTKEKINSMANQVGLPPTYTPAYKFVKNRSVIASKLEFVDSDVIAFCVKIDKFRLVDKLEKKLKKQNRYRRMGGKKIWIVFNRLLLYEIREKIIPFTNSHGYALTDVAFQCDGDCRYFAKDNGLRYADEGRAYMLSDAVAWANNRNLEPHGVCALDLTKILEEKLKSRIVKW